MTSQQIAALPATTPDLILMREIAFQLAVMNETKPPQLTWNEAKKTWDQSTEAIGL